MQNLIPIVMDLDKQMYDIYSLLIKNRIMFLSGEIDLKLSNLIISLLLHLDTEDTVTPISMYINSPGGTASATLAIYDVMQLIHAPIHTYCVGEACSAASILLCAGDKRFITVHSRVLIHQPMGHISGQCSDMQLYVKEAYEIKQIFESIYKKHTTMSTAFLKKCFDRDTVFRSDEAIKHGIVDTILTEKEKK